MKGYVHSIDTLGTLDGPGLRSVVFLQGCALRCIYCHNIDCTIPEEGTLEEASELVKKLIKNKSYWKDNGGVTLGGGDAIFQPEFSLEILQLLKKSDVHTVVDTSFFTSKDVIDLLFPYVDLWMVSIKGLDDEQHKQLINISNVKIQENLHYLDEKISKSNPSGQSIPKIRLRYVVIPSLTDKPSEIEGLIALANSIKNIEAIELLPYTDMGKFKWIHLFGKYAFENISIPSQEDINRIKLDIESKSSVRVIC